MLNRFSKRCITSTSKRGRVKRRFQTLNKTKLNPYVRLLKLTKEEVKLMSKITPPVPPNLRDERVIHLYQNSDGTLNDDMDSNEKISTPGVSSDNFNNQQIVSSSSNRCDGKGLENTQPHETPSAIATKIDQIVQTESISASAKDLDNSTTQINECDQNTAVPITVPLESSLEASVHGEENSIANSEQAEVQCNSFLFKDQPTSSIDQSPKITMNRLKHNTQDSTGHTGQNKESKLTSDGKLGIKRNCENQVDNSERCSKLNQLGKPSKNLHGILRNKKFSNVKPLRKKVRSQELCGTSNSNVSKKEVSPPTATKNPTNTAEHRRKSLENSSARKIHKKTTNLHGKNDPQLKISNTRKEVEEMEDCCANRWNKDEGSTDILPDSEALLQNPTPMTKNTTSNEHLNKKIVSNGINKTTGRKKRTSARRPLGNGLFRKKVHVVPKSNSSLSKSSQAHKDITFKSPSSEKCTNMDAENMNTTEIGKLNSMEQRKDECSTSLVQTHPKHLKDITAQTKRFRADNFTPSKLNNSRHNSTTGSQNETQLENGNNSRNCREVSAACSGQKVTKRKRETILSKDIPVKKNINFLKPNTLVDEVMTAEQNEVEIMPRSDTPQINAEQQQHSSAISSIYEEKIQTSKSISILDLPENKPIVWKFQIEEKTLRNIKFEPTETYNNLQNSPKRGIRIRKNGINKRSSKPDTDEQSSDKSERIKMDLPRHNWLENKLEANGKLSETYWQQKAVCGNNSIIKLKHDKSVASVGSSQSSQISENSAHVIVNGTHNNMSKDFTFSAKMQDRSKYHSTTYHDESSSDSSEPTIIDVITANKPKRKVCEIGTVVKTETQSDVEILDSESRCSSPEITIVYEKEAPKPTVMVTMIAMLNALSERYADPFRDRKPTTETHLLPRNIAIQTDEAQELEDDEKMEKDGRDRSDQNLVSVASTSTSNNRLEDGAPGTSQDPTNENASNEGFEELFHRKKLHNTEIDSKHHIKKLLYNSPNEHLRESLNCETAKTKECRDGSASTLPSHANVFTSNLIPALFGELPNLKLLKQSDYFMPFRSVTCKKEMKETSSQVETIELDVNCAKNCHSLGNEYLYSQTTEKKDPELVNNSDKSPCLVKIPETSICNPEACKQNPCMAACQGDRMRICHTSNIMVNGMEKNNTDDDAVDNNQEDSGTCSVTGNHSSTISSVELINIQPIAEKNSSLRLGESSSVTGRKSTDADNTACDDHRSQCDSLIRSPNSSLPKITYVKDNVLWSFPKDSKDPEHVNSNTDGLLPVSISTRRLLSHVVESEEVLRSSLSPSTSTNSSSQEDTINISSKRTAILQHRDYSKVGESLYSRAATDGNRTYDGAGKAHGSFASIGEQSNQERCEDSPLEHYANNNADVASKRDKSNQIEQEPERESGAVTRNEDKERKKKRSRKPKVVKRILKPTYETTSSESNDTNPVQHEDECDDPRTDSLNQHSVDPLTFDAFNEDTIELSEIINGDSYIPLEKEPDKRSLYEIEMNCIPRNKKRTRFKANKRSEITESDTSSSSSVSQDSHSKEGDEGHGSRSHNSDKVKNTKKNVESVSPSNKQRDSSDQEQPISITMLLTKRESEWVVANSPKSKKRHVSNLKEATAKNPSTEESVNVRTKSKNKKKQKISEIELDVEISSTAAQASDTEFHERSRSSGNSCMEVEIRAPAARNLLTQKSITCNHTSETSEKRLVDQSSDKLQESINALISENDRSADENVLFEQREEKQKIMKACNSGERRLSANSIKNNISSENSLATADAIITFSDSSQLNKLPPLGLENNGTSNEISQNDQIIIHNNRVSVTFDTQHAEHFKNTKESSSKQVRKSTKPQRKRQNNAKQANARNKPIENPSQSSQNGIEYEKYEISSPVNNLNFIYSVPSQIGQQTNNIYPTQQAILHKSDQTCLTNQNTTSGVSRQCLPSAVPFADCEKRLDTNLASAFGQSPSCSRSNHLLCNSFDSAQAQITNARRTEALPQQQNSLEKSRKNAKIVDQPNQMPVSKNEHRNAAYIQQQSANKHSEALNLNNSPVNSNQNVMKNHSNPLEKNVGFPYEISTRGGLDQRNAPTAINGITNPILSRGYPQINNSCLLPARSNPFPAHANHAYNIMHQMQQIPPQSTKYPPQDVNYLPSVIRNGTIPYSPHVPLPVGEPTMQERYNRIPRSHHAVNSACGLPNSCHESMVNRSNPNYNVNMLPAMQQQYHGIPLIQDLPCLCEPGIPASPLCVPVNNNSYMNPPSDRGLVDERRMHDYLHMLFQRIVPNEQYGMSHLPRSEVNSAVYPSDLSVAMRPSEAVQRPNSGARQKHGEQNKNTKAD